MSKKMKVLVSVLVAVLVLTVGGTAMVMAQEEPTPQAGANGLLARVAEILDIPQEDLVNAFRQVRQEMRQEVFFNFLDKAVEEGRFTQEEADEIREWWEQKPEALNLGLLRRVFGLVGPDAKNLLDEGSGEHPELGPPWVGQQQQRAGPPPWVGQQQQRAGPPPWVGQLQPPWLAD